MADRIPSMKISDDENAVLEQFRIKHGLKSRSAAIRRALKIATEPVASEQGVKGVFTDRPWGRWQGGKREQNK